MVTRIHVIAASAALRHGLVAGLGDLPLISPHATALTSRDVSPADIVIAPTSDCPPLDCAQLVKSGARVIVLAPIPRESERVTYENAGVSAYIPMTVGTRELLKAIVTAGLERAPAVADRHAAGSHKATGTGENSPRR